MGIVKYTGPMASFHCPTNAEIRSLKVHFSPKQEGSGDPSPENVRPIVGWDGVEAYKSGKNIWDEQWENGYIIDGIEYSSNTSIRSKNYNSVVPNQTYYLYCGSATSIYFIRPIFYDINKNFISNSSWCANGTFTTPENCQYIRLTTQISIVALYGGTYKHDISVNCLSTDHEYHPYQGETTNYEFGVLGKNKFNWDVPVSESSPGSDPSTAREFTLDTYVIGMSVNNYYRQNYTNWVLNPSVENGVISFSSGSASGYGIVFPLKLSAGQTYFLSGAGNGSAGAMYYNGNGELISYQNGRLNKTITVPENTTTTLIGFYANTSNTDFIFSNIQLELGSTATTYESYDPKNTVYGGWVDLITGEVCEEWGMIMFNGTSESFNTGIYNTSKNYIGAQKTALPNAKGLDSPLTICDRATRLYNPTDTKPFFWTPISGTYLQYIVADVREHSEITNADEALAYTNAYVSENPITVVYSLNTPNTYQLAPTQLQTFLGQNNVWSNADYVEVEYDLHETQNILARKQYIIANQPHVVKPAAAPLQSFVTDMAAPVKECKVYFSPIQEGSGDPSPSNVRNISGWTGIKAYKRGKNIWDEEWEVGALNYSTGLPTEDLSRIRAKNYNMILPNTTYYFFDPTYGGNINVFWYDINKDFIKISGWTGNKAITSPNNAYYFKFIMASSYGTTYNHNISINYPATITSYKSYSGTTLPIDWTTEAGTVYGGYVDLVTGEVWKTYYEINITELGTYRALTINKNNNTQVSWFLSNHLNAPEATGYVAYSRDGYCSCAPFYVNNYYWDSKCQVNNSTTDLVIEGELTAEEVDNWIKAHAPIQIVYPLKTPELIGTITPTQLKTLRGTNNIWSNSNGDITIQFWRH